MSPVTLTLPSPIEGEGVLPSSQSVPPRHALATRVRRAPGRRFLRAGFHSLRRKKGSRFPFPPPRWGRIEVGVTLDVALHVTGHPHPALSHRGRGGFIPAFPPPRRTARCPSAYAP